jgi:hypothetical protein
MLATQMRVKRASREQAARYMQSTMCIYVTMYEKGQRFLSQLRSVFLKEFEKVFRRLEPEKFAAA